MSVSKEIIYQKIKEILDDIDFRGLKAEENQKKFEELLGLSSHEKLKDKNNKFSLYEKIYSNLNDLEKEICICFHSQLNELFDWMNQKSKTNQHYNADPSRELIKIIESIKKSEKLFPKISKKLTISEYYQKQIDYVSNFLGPSGGSAIPEDYQQIEIIDIEPVFFIKDTNSLVKTHNKHKITREFAIEQISKIEKKLESGDFDGVITNVRSLAEDVLIEIYKEVTNLELNRNGNINQYWNKLKKELNLDPKTQLNESLKEIITGLSSILNGLASLRNIAGDGHSRQFKPSKRHAKLAVNSALTFIEFIYDVLEYQKTRINSLLNQFDKIDPVLNFETDISVLIEKTEIKKILNVCDNFLKRQLLQKLVNETKISSYYDSDMFFMKMVILSDVLTNEDIEKIKNKFEKNNQAIGLQDFFKKFDKLICPNLKKTSK